MSQPVGLFLDSVTHLTRNRIKVHSSEQGRMFHVAINDKQREHRWALAPKFYAKCDCLLVLDKQA